jgi:AcrR family transcriptional regulator
MVKPAGDTKALILEAALRVFARSGTAGARTREIAAEAGVNNALVHYYFGTKAQLAEAVFAQTIEGFLPGVFGVLAEPALSLETKIREVASRQVAFHYSHPWLAGYLLSEIHTHPQVVRALVAKTGRPPVHVIRDQVDQAVAAGEIRPISAESLIVNLISMCVFPSAARPLLEQLLGGNEGTFDVFLKERSTHVADFIIAALRP